MASESIKKREKIRFTIGKRVAVTLVIFAFLISAAGIFLGYRNYTTTLEEQLTAIAEGYCLTAGSVVMDSTGGEIPDENGEEYSKVMELLRMIRDNNRLTYITAFLIENGEGICLYDADEPYSMEPGEHFDPPDHELFVENINLLEDGKTMGFITNNAHGEVLNMITGIPDENGKNLFYVGVSVPSGNIAKLKADYLFRLTLVLFFVTVVLTWIAVFLTDRRFVQPIVKVSNIASEFASSDTIDEKGIKELNEIKTGDEVEDLCQAVVKMKEAITDYAARIREETAEKERTEADMNVARRIQAGMLPLNFPNTEDICMTASMTPAREVGGDFYDFYYLDAEHLVLTVADVSGKGTPAALFMAISKVLLKTAVFYAKEPAKALEITNDLLMEYNPEEMFVTCWLGILEVSTGKMVCSNAGHEFPAVKRNGEAFELLKDMHGFVLGGMQGMKYKAYELEMAAGDELFVYSDGVPEATRKDGVLFGTDRMLEALNNKKEASPEDRTGSVKSAIDQFVGDAPQFDDITMLMVQYRCTKA